MARIHLTMTGSYAGHPLCPLSPDAAAHDAAQLGKHNCRAHHACDVVLADPDLCPVCRHLWTCDTVLSDARELRKVTDYTCTSDEHDAAVAATFVLAAVPA